MTPLEESLLRVKIIRAMLEGRLRVEEAVRLQNLTGGIFCVEAKMVLGN